MKPWGAVSNVSGVMTLVAFMKWKKVRVSEVREN